MSPLSERQGVFAAALLDPHAPAPAGWVGPTGAPDARRFAVYRNNVLSSLIEALRDAYPAVQRLLGEDYFNALARLFVAGHPPGSAVMSSYGEAFPAFLEGFEPLAGLAYLPDVARIERAWLEAYHSADVSGDPVDLLHGCLAAVPAEQAGGVRVRMHPSIRIVRSRWPALSIWQANIGERSAQRIDLDLGAEDALLCRPYAQVQVRALAAGEAAFLQQLCSDRSLGEALLCVLPEHPGFELGAHLAGWLGEGLVLRAGLPADLSPVPLSTVTGGSMAGAR